MERVELDDIQPAQEALLYHFRQSIPVVGNVVLTLNLKSFARPTFTLVGGRVPAEGVKMADGEIVPAARVSAYQLAEQAVLQSLPRKGSSLFRQPLWAFLIGSQAGIVDAVRRAVQVLPKLVEWLRTGSPSDYVWVIHPPRAVPADVPPSTPPGA
jgi:hypothetical protein